MTDKVFRFLPGERILQIVGWPGPDCDDCEVLRDDGGETVLIRWQVYGKGPFFETEVPRSRLMWMRGTPTSDRFHLWKSEGIASRE